MLAPWGLAIPTPIVGHDGENDLALATGANTSTRCPRERGLIRFDAAVIRVRQWVSAALPNQQVTGLAPVCEHRVVETRTGEVHPFQAQPKIDAEDVGLGEPRALEVHFG